MTFVMRVLGAVAVLLACTVAMSSGRLSAGEAQPVLEVLGSGSLPSSENGVFTRSGRFFVADARGIAEVRRETDAREGCVPEPSRAFVVCRIVEPQLENGRPCSFTGLTSDGVLLYAVCTDQISIGDVQGASLFQIAIGESGADRVRVRSFSDPTSYNGMTALDPTTLLLTDSAASPLGSLQRPAVVRVEITDLETLEFEVTRWIDASPLFLLPNGIANDGEAVYFAGGQQLLRIPLQPDESPGPMEQIFETRGGLLIDDLAVVDDRLAVTEVSPGSAQNSIVLVDKRGRGTEQRVATGEVSLSDLALGPGELFGQGALAATSFFQGGLFVIPAAAF